MFGNKEGDPIDVLVIEDTKIDGKEVAAGTVLKKIDAQLAMELASGGKVRAATEDALSELKRNQANAAKAAEARAAAEAQRTAATQAASAEVVAAAVAATLKTMGLVAVK